MLISTGNVCLHGYELTNAVDETEVVLKYLTIKTYLFLSVAGYYLRLFISPKKCTSIP